MTIALTGPETYGTLYLAETLELVRTELPQADVAVLRHPPGERQQPWAAT